MSTAANMCIAESVAEHFKFQHTNSIKLHIRRDGKQLNFYFYLHHLYFNSALVTGRDSGIIFMGSIVEYGQAKRTQPKSQTSGKLNKINIQAI